MDAGEGKASHEEPGRRAFFARLFWSGIALVSAGLAIPVGGYFLSPLFVKPKGHEVDLGELESFPLGEPKRIEFAMRQREGWITRAVRAIAWVVRQKDRVVVFDPHCTHLGCAYHWDPAADRFFCPCHGGVFSINGCVKAGPPPRPLDIYPSTVRNGRLYADLSPVRNVGVGTWRCGAHGNRPSKV